MSNRDSLGFGDLLPQDVVDIFAQEKHSRRGQKKRSRSLGRALGWLKGKKRKDLGGKGQSLGLGPALDLALDGHPAGHQGGHKGGQRSGRQNYPQGNSHAIPKLDDDDKTPAPPLFQENVFIEASRPKYLENLHSEAQEGLKMMQQEETNDGIEYRDNESTISTVTVQTDGEGGGFVTDSTIGDTTSVVSVQSSVSTRSSRSGLTRQGSTFRPLNSGKKSEKAKIRRRHRKTVAGIPQHVQMELGLDRGNWKTTKRLDEEQLYNGETDDSLTNDGPQQAPGSQKGASANLHETNAIQPLNKDQLEQLSDTYAGHRDDMALLHCLGPDLSGEQRPRSLAVPWMTTANSLQPESPSPVMSMSPQAAYMSKIIPNAVLPPSIDVVEISRGRSRNSVRTVSKTSLLLSSPAPSRASSRASSSRTTSSRASTITSASRHNPPNLSDSSCWSNSESSETLVSDSSTISSSSTPKQKRPQDRDGPTKEDKNTVQSSIGKNTKCTSNGKVIITEDVVKKEGSFVRSLSVMKPKRAPPPPSRSYSLHGKMKRRSRDLAEATVILGETSGEENRKNKSGSSPMPSVIIESPGYSADTSSLEDSTGSVSFSPFRSQLQALNAEEAAKVVKTVSKDASQELLQDNKLNKTVSPSSGYSSQDGTSTQLPKQPYSSSPRRKNGILAKLQRFFPGSTSAARTPPPLTNSEAPENIKSTEDLKPHTSVDTASVSPSVRTLIDLFNIPPPPKVHAPPPPPPEVWAHSKRSIELLLGPPAPDNILAIIKKNPKDRRQQRKSPPASADGSVQSLVTERKHKNPTVTVESVNGSLHVLEPKKVKESGILNVEIHKEKNDRLAEQNVDLKGTRIVTEKDEKVRVSDILNGMLAKAVERREERLTAVREEEAKKTHTTDNMDTLTTILPRILPSPSPPVHNPPKPPAKQTTEFTPVPAVQAVSPEFSWPAPPPPTGLSAPDEMDFPLPPPPMFGEEELVLPVQVPPETTISSDDSLNTTTSVVSVVKTQCVRVTTEAEPQKPSTSQGNVHKPLYIPPPPPYTAPPPPTKAVSLHTIKNVSPVLPEEVSPPPPPKEVSLPPPKEHSPPLPKEVPSSPPKEVSPPPPKEPSPPPPKEAFPPPPEEVPLLPCKEISPPLPKEISPVPSEEVTLPLPKEVSPPPPTQVSPVKPKESAPCLIQAPHPSDKDVSSTLDTVVSPSPVKEDSPLPPQEVTTLSTEEVSPPSSQENATTIIKLTPPQSIPPPPPLLSQPQSSEIDLPLENVPAESETNPVSSNSILTPPKSIPPPPPIQLLHQPQVSSPNTDSLVTQEAHHSPPSEVSFHSTLENSLPPEKAQDLSPSPPVDISLPPPLPVQVLASIKHQPSPASTENQPPEITSAPVVQEEPTPIVTPSLLQMVKLRSVNSSPELPKAQDHPETEVAMRTQQPSNQIPTSSLSGEAPQKPIRKSLITTSPTSTSPPAIITSQPLLPTSQPTVVPSASSSTVLSPTKKSPPVMTASPSMNLQEAIRLRTAARSLGPPVSRLSLHSPTSPTDLHKSPSNTASFIFSKSNKKVVIETKPAPETNTTIHLNQEAFSGAGLCEGESVKKGVKVPPPVAKKPKAKGKEIETIEGTEQTAGQEALQESIMDAAEKSNGTAGTVEGGGTPST